MCLPEEGKKEALRGSIVARIRQGLPTVIRPSNVTFKGDGSRIETSGNKLTNGHV